MTDKYVYTSSFIRNLIDNEVRTPEGKPVRQRIEMDSATSEETSFSLTNEKALDLLNKIDAAMRDESGTGGVRITMYAKRSKNKETGEVFDSASLFVAAQRPQTQGYGQRRPSFGARGGGGRRNFPQQGQQTQRGPVQPRQQAASPPVQLPPAPQQSQGYGTQAGYPQPLRQDAPPAKALPRPLGAPTVQPTLPPAAPADYGNPINEEIPF